MGVEQKVPNSYITNCLHWNNFLHSATANATYFLLPSLQALPVHQGLLKAACVKGKHIRKRRFPNRTVGIQHQTTHSSPKSRCTNTLEKLGRYKRTPNARV